MLLLNVLWFLFTASTESLVSCEGTYGEFLSILVNGSRFSFITTFPVFMTYTSLF